MRKSRKNYWAGALALATLFSCGACGPPLSSAASGSSTASTPSSGSVAAAQSADNIPALPAFTSEQALRDRIARAEYATAQAAQKMADLATECEDCQAELRQVADDAQLRLTLVGGTWEPWEQPQSGEPLPQPPAVGDAPMTPGPLAGYMLATAEAQLQDLAASGSEHAATYAEAIAGRIASAASLARFYEVSEVSEKAALTPERLETSAGRELPVDEESPPAQSADADSATFALLAFDCLAATSGRTPLVYTNEGAEADLHRELVARQRDLLAWGTPDDRPVRCGAAPTSVDELMTETVAVDIALLSEEDPELRSLGAKWLTEDMQTWIALGSPSTVAPGTGE